MRTLDLVLKYGTFSACAYEAFAGFTRLTPTISQVVGVHEWVGAPILIALGIHFYWPQITALYKRKVTK